VVPVWCNGALLPPSTRVFWADGPPLHLHEAMKPELGTGHSRHDPQTTTHRPEKFASNPTPVASNATRCTHRALASNPFRSSQWGPLHIPGVSLSAVLWCLVFAARRSSLVPLTPAAAAAGPGPASTASLEIIHTPCAYALPD
jgi:hypothetical protein